MNLSSNEYIGIKQVEVLLGVSSATIKNWIKYSYLIPYKNNKSLTFNINEVQNLKEKIISGEINRLNKRANKQSSKLTFIPDEYIEDKETIQSIKYIIQECIDNKLEKYTVLYSIILNLLQDKKLINDKFISKNKIINKELDWWQSKTEGHYSSFLKIKIPDTRDFLGVIYQSIINEGQKSQGGSYYTPKKVVDEIIKLYVNDSNTFLDPCCGTGQFLLSATEKIKDPNKIWGFDIDEIAVRLARINLILKFPNIQFKPNIYHTNFLTLNSNPLFKSDSIPLFDIIATNPPWGAHFSKQQNIELKFIYPKIKSGEIFSYFIQQGLNFLNQDGALAFVLPESILNVKTHKDIREILVEKYHIKKIIYLNRLFKNVFTPVIRLDIIKNNSSNNIIEAEKNNIKYSISQDKLKRQLDFVLNVFQDNQDIDLLDKIYNTKHITLKNQADWALGIVTGNNDKYLLNKKTKNNEPIITGKEIKKFIISKNSKYIEFEPSNFQQVAPESKYRSKEKLFYKFISKELVFAYDNKQTLSLNSANILIPKLKNYPIKTILALFNSSLYQFIYQKKIGSIKILKNDLEQLPLPIIDQNIHNKIEEQVNILLDTQQDIKDRKTVFNSLDDFIMNIFNLSREEKEYIKKNIKTSNKLLDNN
jgi:type I restriction-modification system DNA methylase subunit